MGFRLRPARRRSQVALPHPQPGLVGGQPGEGGAGCRNRCLREPRLTALDSIQRSIVITLGLVHLRQDNVSTHQQQALDCPPQQINALCRRVCRPRQVVPFIEYLGAADMADAGGWYQPPTQPCA